MRWVKHVTRTGEKRHAYNILVGRHEREEWILRKYGGKV
jgi:hypothetical protein